MTRLRYRSDSRSHVGCVRTVNEDSLLARDDAALWVVADGMGGHDNGQWASQTLIAHFATLDLAIATESRGPAMLQALENGNFAIFQEGQANGKQMGTTAVMCHLDADRLLCLWVGDSRAYRSRRGVLEQLTRDHTVVQELVDRGSLAPEDVETHPMSHVLSHAVGVEATLNFDGFSDQALPGDHYLLCSDGLTKVVTHAEIEALLAIPNIASAADRMIALALDRGSPDNVSLVIISVDEATAITPMSAL